MFAVLWVLLALVALAIIWGVYFFIGLRLSRFFLEYCIANHGHDYCRDRDCRSRVRSYNYFNSIYDHDLSRPNPRDWWKSLSKDQRDRYREKSLLEEEDKELEKRDRILKCCESKARDMCNGWVFHLPSVMKSQAFGKALSEIGEEKREMARIDKLVEEYRRNELTATDAWDSLYSLAEKESGSKGKGKR